MLEWNDYLILLAIARNKSLYRAAREMGVAVSTMMRRITQIENRAGATLFHKTKAGHMPTPIGEILLSKAASMETLAQAAEQSLQSAVNARQNEIHISASEVIAPFFVARHLPTIKENFPGANITLTVTDQSPSKVIEEFDISLWPSTPSNEELFGRRLTKVKWAFYGIKKLDGPAGELKPSTESVVRLFSRERGSKIILNQTEGLDETKPNLSTNSLLTAAALATSGGTIAHLPCILGANWPRLQQLSLPNEHQIGELWAIFRKNQAQQPHIRSVINALVSAAEQDKSLFLGS